MVGAAVAHQEEERAEDEEEPEQEDHSEQQQHVESSEAPSSTAEPAEATSVLGRRNQPEDWSDDDVPLPQVSSSAKTSRENTRIPVRIAIQERFAAASPAVSQEETPSLCCAITRVVCRGHREE